MARNLVLITGESASGKTTSLMNLKNQEGVLYLNYEAGKDLTFPNKFKKIKGAMVAEQIGAIFEKAEQDPTIHTIVIDSVTFLMELYESQEVLTSTDTRAAWGRYAQFFKELMQKYVAGSTKNVVMLAHNTTDLDERGNIKTFIKVKGSLMNNGLEAFFSNIVYTKVMPVKDLKEMEYDPNLLHITEEDELLGFKYVFQTRLTKETAGSRIRSQIGLFNKNQTYMDNDVELLLQHLENYMGYESNRV